MRIIKRSSGHIALLITNIIFGLNMPVSRSLLPDVLKPFSLHFFRVLGATLLFWTASFLIKRAKIPLKDLVKLFFAGMLGVLINQLSFIIGLSTTSPVTASLIATLLPVITMILSFLILHEPISWMKITGVAVGASGALILILASAEGSAGSSLQGVLLILLSALSYALYLTLFKKIIATYHPVHIMKWMFLFAFMVSIPFCYTDFMQTPFSQLPAEAWLRIGYVVMLSTFFAYLLIPVGQKTVRPTTLSMYNYLQPVVASGVAIAAGMDSFGYENILSAILVFAGVYIVTQSKSRIQLEMQRRRKNIQKIRRAKAM